MDRIGQPGVVDEARLLTVVTVLASRAAWRLVRREMAEPDEVEDIAQDIVLDCLARLRSGRWRVTTTLGALVASMVWHKLMWRKRGELHGLERDTQHLADREAQTPRWMDPDDAFDEREHFLICRRALAELPARRRTAFLLVRDEGLTYRDAASRLGVSLGLVASDVKRAQGHIRARLTEARCEIMPPSMTRPSRRKSRSRRPRPDAPGT